MDGLEDSFYLDEKIRTHEIRQALLFNLYQYIGIPRLNSFNAIINNGGTLDDYKEYKNYNSIYYGIVTVDLTDGLDAIEIEGNAFYEFLSNISLYITNTTEHVITGLDDYTTFATNQLTVYADEMFVAKEQSYFYSNIDGLLDYVQSNESPVITAPANITVAADSSSGTSFNQFGHSILFKWGNSSGL